MNTNKRMGKGVTVLNVSEIDHENIKGESVLILGDCLEALKKLPSNSIDTLITDPPAGISFMGKSWDKDKGGRKQWITWLTTVMKECHRVLKPGATALVWAIPRTSHWTATAVEDAGFQIKDIIMHIFGSGFPKSHNIGKSTKEKEWEGYGTALKPAAEHWILAHKKNDGTYANNALKHGVSGLNIDGGRIEGNWKTVPPNKGGRKSGIMGEKVEHPGGECHLKGRFPANIILDEEAGRMLDEQSGMSKGGSSIRKNSKNPYGNDRTWSVSNTPAQETVGYTDKGGASRFFYCAKASKRERNANGQVANIHPTCKPISLMRYLVRLTATPTGGTVLDPFAGSCTTAIACIRENRPYIMIEQDPEYGDIGKQRIDVEPVPML